MNLLDRRDGRARRRRQAGPGPTAADANQIAAGETYVRQLSGSSSRLGESWTCTTVARTLRRPACPCIPKSRSPYPSSGKTCRGQHRNDRPRERPVRLAMRSKKHARTALHRVIGIDGESTSKGDRDCAAETGRDMGIVTGLAAGSQADPDAEECDDPCSLRTSGTSSAILQPQGRRSRWGADDEGHLARWRCVSVHCWRACRL